MIHILVVDDDVKLNKTVCTYLNDCGFQAKGVLDAQLAFEEMYNNLYDLIVSDIMMPQMDGFEFATAVRKVNKHIPSMWARMKTELLYDRYDSEQLTVEHLKSLVWRYFMSYWNNRRICSANGGLPPMVKRSRFYAAQAMAA